MMFLYASLVALVHLPLTHTNCSGGGMMVTWFGGAARKVSLRARMASCTSSGWHSQIPSQATAARAFGKRLFVTLRMLRIVVKLVLTALLRSRGDITSTKR